MKAVASPYYPPRAGAIGRRLNRWYRFRRTLQLERLTPPIEVRSWWRFAFWMLVPGSLGLARGQRLLGGILMAIWLLLGAVYWVWMGTAISPLAYVAMSAIHSISASMTIALCLPHLPPRSRARRASFYALLFVISTYAILPLSFTNPIVQPLRVRDATVLINTARPVSALRRGDWVGYRIRNEPGYFWMNAHPALVPVIYYRPRTEQIGIDRILAMPGETLRFHPDSFEVNAVFYQRVSDQMPTAGEYTLGDDAFFIWPAAIRFAHAGEGGHDLLRGIAVVGKDRVIGSPYHQWFWRKQTFEPLVVLEKLPLP